MAIELHNDGGHACVMFTDLVHEVHGEGVQANQFLVVDHGHGALIDPGGNMTYNALYMECSRHFPPKQLAMILASHADPDVIASVSHWLVGTDCLVYISAVWSNFVPHFCGAGRVDGRVVPIPDAGASIVLGDSVMHAVPAHFLHSAGNFQFYDPTARMLFSGDLGASMVSGAEAAIPVEDQLGEHVEAMAAFHVRYMACNKALRLWAGMARQLDLEWLVPQHGRPLKGRRPIEQFFDWVETLECGTDLVTEATYRPPFAWAGDR
ncbi:MAG: MBL fold metallo-hydrolase [Burkholderiales bacterium]|jgi:flavorubredoxin|nr:MBL fold metallo-hydrolase [Burkholderiales bacterium]